MRRDPEWWDRFFLGSAQYFSGASKDPSTQTGAVIIGPNKRVVSIGFNGFAADMSDCDEVYKNREMKYSRIIHCEMNAVLFAGGVPPGSTLYTWPFLSCDRCAVHMIQAGLRRFVAPKPTEDALSRWSRSLDDARLYFAEVGAEVVELDLTI